MRVEDFHLVFVASGSLATLKGKKELMACHQFSLFV
jgi:hypothetical protein